MTKANECTCPSGDSSLRHPCPAHPAPVEQAGGDERAAFFKHLIGRHPAHETEIVRVLEHNYAAWKAWQARAALAQPSLMPPDRGPWHAVKWDGGRRVDLSSDDFEHDVALTVSGDFVEGDKFRYAQELAAWMNAHLAQPSPARAEQPEAERPEVVAWQYRVTAGPQTGWSLWHPGKGEEFERSYTVERRPLMTVAQHERIVGELRAVIAQLRQHKNDYMDSGQETYRALQNEIREREAEIARLDGLVSGRTAERDAALVEVERLRQFERICEGLPQDAIDGGWTVQGIRGYAKRLEDQLKVALDRVAELENQEPVAYVLFRDGEVYYETDDNIVISNTPGDETDLYRWLPVFTAPAAQAQQLHDLDKQCRDDVARALGLRPSQERGFAWSYLLASIKSCVKASEDAAQAQHSVPEEFIGRLSEFLAQRGATGKALLRELRTVLASAPGKEGL
ncbi:hypothetical protein [Pseudomonas aeruginosa]|uniref:hypothetical protein n=1 Tax=Pseudomonas aeruginosa TaxID=287 RepID=UPI0027399F3A|nr:hypothetical protein [Pseudomonas aeruginosa]HCF1695878.1 hypothetical protein [Pseudomonas aeruginosa]HCF1715850.1 hypothetical protein [Pseudomonas aeruginosa]